MVNGSQGSTSPSFSCRELHTEKMNWRNNRELRVDSCNLEVYGGEAREDTVTANRVV